MKEQGLRYNEGKLRVDLITPEITEAIAKVLTAGSLKYNDHNWEKGMSWSKVIASLKRHLLAFEKGIDTDEEDQLRHIDHLLCNAGFLATYYKTHPEYDDRQQLFFDKRVALDLDGVLCDFNTAVRKKFNIESEPSSWFYSYKFNPQMWEELKKDKTFWIDEIQPYFDGHTIPFEPVCYVTHRHIPKEWCEIWLEKNGFPCAPVHVVDGSKVPILKEMVDNDKLDWFVDDKYDNFLELNKAGVFTYLMDRPWNSRYEVGHRRLYNLKDLVK